MDDNKSQTEMSQALQLCELFGGTCDDVEVGVFNQNGCGQGQNGCGQDRKSVV